MKLDLFLTSLTKINAKWIKDLENNLRTIKLMEENTGKKFFDAGFSNYFLDMTPTAQATKAKINK